MNLNFHKHTIAAGQSVKVSARGRFVRGWNSTARYELRLDDGPIMFFEKGQGADFPSTFESVEIINPTATAQVIEIATADGFIDDKRPIGLALVGYGSASYGAESVSTTAIEIAPADDGRASALVQNIGPGSIFIGTDASVTDATGIEIAGGNSAKLTLQSAIYAIATSGTQDVRVLVEGV